MTNQPVIETIKNISDKKLMLDILGNMNCSDVSNLINLLEFTDEPTKEKWYELIKIIL